MATPQKTYYENNNVCRLCADGKDYERSTNIFSEKKKIAQDINDILGIRVTEDDGLPCTVCRKCEGKLRNFKEFINLVQETQQNLKGRTKRCQNFSPSIEPPGKKSVSSRKNTLGKCLLEQFQSSDSAEAHLNTTSITVEEVGNPV